MSGNAPFSIRTIQYLLRRSLVLARCPALLLRQPQQLDDQGRHDRHRTHRGIVLAMLPIQIPGKLRAQLAGRSKGWHQSGNSTRVIRKFGKVLREKQFFRPNHWQVDCYEHHDKNCDDPPTSGRECKTLSHYKRTEVERVAGIRIRPGGRQPFVLLHVSRGQRADQQTWNDEKRTYQKGYRERVGEPQVKCCHSETQGHSTAMRDS